MTADLVLTLTIVRQRRFGFMSMLSFSCTVLVTWEGVLMSVSDIARKAATVAHSILSLFTESFTKYDCWISIDGRIYIDYV